MELLRRLLKRAVGINLASDWFSPVALILYLGSLTIVGLLLVKLSDWTDKTWFSATEVGNLGEWIGGLAAGAALLAIGHQQAIDRNKGQLDDIHDLRRELQDLDLQSRSWITDLTTWRLKAQDRLDPTQFSALAEVLGLISQLVDDLGKETQQSTGYADIDVSISEANQARMRRQEDRKLRIRRLVRLVITSSRPSRATIDEIMDNYDQA